MASVEATKQLWYSSDAKTWHRGEVPRAPGLAGIYLASVPGAFIAIGSTASAPGSPAEAAPVWTSRNGRTWSRATSAGAPALGIGLFPAARLHRDWLAISQTALTDPDVRAAFSSPDGVHWKSVTGAAVPDRFGNVLASSADRTRVFGIQFEVYRPRYSFGGRLWSTRDATTWTEVTSFHDQMPVANPDHLVRLGHWWILGGNAGTADGQRRASMWTSPDLRHWYEMPKSLEGRKSGGAAVTLTRGRGLVVGISGGDGGRFVWVWSPPG